ncbi:MAG: bifunctional demethylmenaquinone methyltransferase/2-methoxy-6-polyprenyl-1,4-benzoquinol methylase UbiE [Gammaproteobacteria bacterium]|nr:bifunctional demethylmenaquinone methyltransferase/2-methoxy-6-polyprenyl-1,4-benzoquinol methylase UbiE [Gammaproteobacteria bacterium]
MNQSDDTDFGFERVSRAEKTRRVAGVFRSVAERYDVMNDLMSMGLHRIMKRMTVEMSGVREGDRVLDLAGGTGDLAALFSPLVGQTGAVVLADINAAMMEVGRDRLCDRGITNVRFAQADAEALPFADGAFRCVTIAFGLRNVTDKDRALREMHRVLMPGGRLLVLEFSKAENPVVSAAYSAFQALWPTVGRAVTGDAGAYKYLVESIEMHPSQRALKLMMQDAGFADATYDNLLNGIAAIHSGTRTPS